MTTKRCELCGTLHASQRDSISLSVSSSEKRDRSFEHYSICERCANTLYNQLESMKTDSLDKHVVLKASDELVIKQTALINEMSQCIRRTVMDLQRICKYPTDNKNATEIIESTLERLSKYLDCCD